MSSATATEGKSTTVSSGHTVTLAAVIRSEWIKFRSVRSMPITLIIAGLLFVVLTVVGAAMGSEPQPGTKTVTGLFGAGIVVLFSKLALIVMGALAVTSEYSHNTIRTTLAVVPTRLPVLFAKMIVVAVITFVVMALSTLVAWALEMMILSAKGLTYAGTPTHALELVVGTVISATVAAVLAVVIGTITRSAAATIGICVGFLIVLNMVLGLMIPDTWKTVRQFGPFHGANEIGTVGLDVSYSNYASMVAWVIGLTVIAAVMLRKRDA